MKTRSLPLIGSIILFTSACAVATEEEPGADEAVVSASDAITGRASVGAELVTTTRVNLRESPSLTARVIRVLPEGTEVKVVAADATAGFYEVTQAGERGWVYGVYLAEDAAAPGAGAGGAGSCFDTRMASKLASEARDVDGERSQGLCYRYVKGHLERAGIAVRSAMAAQYQPSAYLFATWAKRNPADLARLGLAESDVALSNVPAGAILVWRPGQCGYSADHGHIEITIGGGRACSDFCGNIRRTCGRPAIFVPVQRGCE